MPSRMRVAPPLVLLSAFATCLWLAACLTGSGETSGTVSPTLITLTPDSFSDQVLCGKVQGAWKTYVATLTDVTWPDQPFQLASSMPVLCSMPVSFAFVIPGHSYVVDIDAYDRDDLVPYGPPSSGSRHMVDPGTGQDVAPRWKASCGRLVRASLGTDAATDADDLDGAPTDADSGVATLDQTPVTAQLNVNVRVQACQPLVEQDSPPAASVVVDLASVRGDLSCGSGAGAIDHFRVVPSLPALESKQADCDETVSFGSVTPGLDYAFNVQAFEKDATSPRWAAKCTATARQGLGVPAACETLTTQGAIRIDIASLLAASGHRCSDTDVVQYRASLTASDVPAVRQGCGMDALFSPLAVGAWQVVIDAFNSEGDAVLSAWCDAAVTPATTTTATCRFVAPAR
jgi:hypothetical protein